MRRRGRTTMKKVWNQTGKEAIQMRGGVPVGPNSGNIVGILTTLARNSRKCPLHYEDWRDLVRDHGDDLIGEVRAKFEFLDENVAVTDEWILDTLSRMRRDYKSKLKREYFTVNPDVIAPHDVALVKRKKDAAVWLESGDLLRAKDLCFTELEGV